MQKNQLSFRKAENTLSDYEIMYRLKCDKLNIEWSGFSTVPNYENFKGWYFHQLKDNLRKIGFGLYNEIIVGFYYILPIEGDPNSFELAMGVLSEYGGFGYGTQLIKEAVCVVKKLYKNARCIAWVSEQNLASEHVFMKNGFIKTVKSDKRNLKLLGEHTFYLWIKIV